MKMTQVRICGVQTEIPESGYDWIVALSQCHPHSVTDRGILHCHRYGEARHEWWSETAFPNSGFAFTHPRAVAKRLAEPASLSRSQQAREVPPMPYHRCDQPQPTPEAFGARLGVHLFYPHPDPFHERHAGTPAPHGRTAPPMEEGPPRSSGWANASLT